MTQDARLQGVRQRLQTGALLVAGHLVHFTDQHWQEYGGQDLYNTWTYSKVEPHQRLEFVLNFSDERGNKQDPAKLGLPPGIPMDVPHAITFKALGDRRTEMTVAEYGYTSAQAADTSKVGLDQVLDKMAASFATAGQ